MWPWRRLRKDVCVRERERERVGEGRDGEKYYYLK